MKLLKILITINFAVVFLACKNNISSEDLKKFAATETYPTDNYLDTVTPKRALIIVAHDDDDCVMAGTIAKLKTQGWVIKQFSLQKHKGLDTLTHPSHITCDGNELLLKDGVYRLGMDTLTYGAYPLAYAEIDKQFYTAKVSEALVDKINKFKPSVIFTLDDIKGGYGHPEHVFVSRLVVKLFKEDLISCKRIYQSVYTPHMEREIVYKWLDMQLKDWNHPNLSLISNKLYDVKGMPEPNVQVTISKFADQKMKYLLAYNEDVRRNIRKFIPYFETVDAQTYFKVFNREFFRIIYSDN